MLVVLVLGDGAGHAAVLVLLELDERRRVAHLGARLDGGGAHDRGVRLALAGLVVGVRAVAGGIGAVAALAVLVADAALELHVGLAGVLDGLGDPVDGLAGALDPQLDEVVVAVAVRVAHDVLESVLLGDLELGELGERLLLQLGVDGADVLAHALDEVLGVALDNQDLVARLGGRQGAGNAARAEAADEDFGVDGLGDGRLVDLRGGAEPGGRLLGQGVERLGAAGLGGRGDGARCGDARRGQTGTLQEAAAAYRALHDDYLLICVRPTRGCNGTRGDGRTVLATAYGGIRGIGKRAAPQPRRRLTVGIMHPDDQRAPLPCRGNLCR